MCFVVFSVSGSGGLAGRRDFGPALLAGGCPGVFGVVVVGGLVGGGVVVCLPRQRQVTGIKLEAADA